MSGHVHREFPGKFESSNLSRNNLSREIGRTRRGCGLSPGAGLGAVFEGSTGGSAASRRVAEKGGLGFDLDPKSIPQTGRGGGLDRQRAQIGCDAQGMGGSPRKHDPDISVVESPADRVGRPGN